MTDKMETLKSIRKVTDYSDFNLYQMKVHYNYNLEKVIQSRITDDATLIKAILNEALPQGSSGTNIDLGAFGCTAFKMKCIDGKLRMGRSYDFAQDTSGMLVYCPPIKEIRFASMGFAALNNIWSNDPLEKGNLGALAAPFVCLDGINENGVAIAVLTLDSNPMRPTDDQRPTITTSLAIRLVLDRAIDAKHAAELLGQYNMFASFGRDYHFFITDSGGTAIGIEYSLDENRKFIHTETVPLSTGARPLQAMTNFFISYINKVKPYQGNTVYGHGRERYDRVIDFMDKYENHYTEKIAWKTLISVVQDPGDNITSNTQWSVMYDMTDKKLKIVFRRHFEENWRYTLGDEQMVRGIGDEWMKEYYDETREN